jgi:hypothetical protein
MTVVNIASAAVYTKDFQIREKIQLYTMALVFLVLLYHSPSGLVLYWLCNNIYSLVKNISQKNKTAKRIIMTALAYASLCLAGCILFLHTGALKKRILVSIFMAVPGGIFLFSDYFKIKKEYLTSKARKILKTRLKTKNTALDRTGTFVYSALALCLLAGLVIPSRLIASSVSEFSFIEPLTSPLPFVGITLLQSTGFFLWTLGVFFLSSAKARKILTAFITFALGAVLVDVYLFSGNYGFLTPELKFSDFVRAPFSESALNIAVIALICAFLLYLLICKRRLILFSAQTILIAAFLIIGIMDTVKISEGFKSVHSAMALPEDEKRYAFSKTGKNILVIMLDRAISSYIPYIFEEKPELLNSFSGFTYYPNCASFGGHTVFGAPTIFGGYEYTPLEMRKRADKTMREKYYESLLVMPVLMESAGFEVTVSDQPYADFSIYEPFPGITAQRNKGRYRRHFERQKLPSINGKYYYEILYANLSRFSFFKFAPLPFRAFVYDTSDYLSVIKWGNQYADYPNAMLDNYSTLYYLSTITRIIGERKNIASIFVNDLTHEPAFLQAPEYTPESASVEEVNETSGKGKENPHYSVNMAAFLLLGKWFDFLKENGVYDNTKIIIVSDHGSQYVQVINTPALPNGDLIEFYNPLLLVKDFNADFSLKTDNAFMTNADALPILTEGLIADPINPFTGKKIATDKDQGALITTSRLWQPEKHFSKYRFDIKPDEWLFVRDNIFEPANWRKTAVED